MNALCAHECIFLSSRLQTDSVCKYVFSATVVSASTAGRAGEKGKDDYLRSERYFFQSVAANFGARPTLRQRANVYILKLREQRSGIRFVVLRNILNLFSLRSVAKKFMSINMNVAILYVDSIQIILHNNNNV